MGDEEPVGHRGQHECPEQRGASTERPRDPLVEEVEGEDGEQDHRGADGPLRVPGRLRAGPDEHVVGLVVDAQRGHRHGLHPHVEDRLAPEPPVLSPPEADPVVAGQHLAGDLAVVGLPGIPQRVAAHAGEVEARPRHDDPEAVTGKEGAIDAVLVLAEGAERPADVEDRRRAGGERQGDQDAPADLGKAPPAGGEPEQQAEQGQGRQQARERARQRRQGRRRRDAIVGVVERAEEIHRSPGRDGDEQGSERHTPAQLPPVSHEQEGHERSDDQGDATAHDAQGIASPHEPRSLGRRVGLGRCRLAVGGIGAGTAVGLCGRGRGRSGSRAGRGPVLLGFRIFGARRRVRLTHVQAGGSTRPQGGAVFPRPTLSTRWPPGTTCSVGPRLRALRRTAPDSAR